MVKAAALIFSILLLHSAWAAPSKSLLLRDWKIDLPVSAEVVRGHRKNGELAYDRENFGGRGVTVTDVVADFNDIGFNDRTRSVVVYSGTWELCHDMQFRGECQVLVPGRYPQMQGALDREVSSARPIAERVVEQRPAYGVRPGRIRAVLYEGPRFTGRSYVVDENVLRNLDGTGFNDRASSMRIERGYWIFCSDAQFAGECLTFGPGEYPQLPPTLDNRISSGRRIANDYPYREQPRWGG